MLGCGVEEMPDVESFSDRENAECKINAESRPGGRIALH